MEWSYTERVSQKRQEVLLADRDFSDIVSRILEEMQITHFDVCRGDFGEVRGCKRPEFALQVCKETFDLFFNSPHGYRGQYHKSIEDGEKANKALMSKLSERMIAYAKDRTTKHTMNEEELIRSLNLGSSKIWIDEQGIRAQRGDDITDLKVDLKVKPWLTVARRYVADPDKFPDLNKEIKAVDGVKAPTGTILEVKGAFIDENDKERVADDKENRSQQIHLYGFT